MVYRITGGLFLLCLGLNMLGVAVIGGTVVGVLGVVAGIALLAGV